MQTFMSRCHDTIAPIAELALDEVTQQIESVFEENLSVYLKMDGFLSDTSQHSMPVSKDRVLYLLLLKYCLLLQP